MFFPPTFIGGRPEFESAVAETFVLAYLGFFFSLFPRILLPLPIRLPSSLQCPKKS